MKAWTKPFKEIMANGLEQEFRKCLRCDLWVPNDDQVLIDHQQKHNN